MLACVVLLPLPAHADDAPLTASEQKRIADLSMQMNVQLSNAENYEAKLQAQIDHVNAIANDRLADLSAQIKIIKDTAENREIVRRSQCSVPLLWIGCPPPAR
jgi:hypothetical protein